MLTLTVEVNPVCYENRNKRQIDEHAHIVSQFYCQSLTKTLLFLILR